MFFRITDFVLGNIRLDVNIAFKISIFQFNLPLSYNKVPLIFIEYLTTEMETSDK